MKAVARTVASTNIGSMPKIRFARSLAPSQRGCVERTTILEPVPIGYCLTRCHRNVVGVATCHDEQRSDSRTAKDHCGKERIVRMPCTPCDKARPESSATEKQRAYSEEFHQRAQLHNSTQNVDCGERQRDIERRRRRRGESGERVGDGGNAMPVGRAADILALAHASTRRSRRSSSYGAAVYSGSRHHIAAGARARSFGHAVCDAAGSRGLARAVRRPQARSIRATRPTRPTFSYP